jgi:rubrerythrin
MASMDIDSFLRHPLSRRRFLGAAGLAGGSATLLGACSDDTKNPALTGPDESDEADIEILNGALDLEHMAVASYKAAAGALTGARLQIAQTFLEHEQAHADALSSAIEDAGGMPNKPESAYDVPRLRSQTAALRFALELESTAIAAYIDFLPKLSDGDLRATFAAIVTTEAEHEVVLRDALGAQPVPAAFVQGRAA